MDMDKVVQAFATMVFTGVIDVMQQVDPLDKTQLDAHQARVKTVISDVGNWLKNLSPNAIACLDAREYLPFSAGWMPLSDLELYDTTAVCAAVQWCIKSVLADRTYDVVDVVHGAGEYLADITDHKMGWLAERAANLLALNL